MLQLAVYTEGVGRSISQFSGRMRKHLEQALGETWVLTVTEGITQNYSETAFTLKRSCEND